jgi:hypothetical protein
MSISLPEPNGTPLTAQHDARDFNRAWVKAWLGVVPGVVNAVTVQRTRKQQVKRALSVIFARPQAYTAGIMSLAVPIALLLIQTAS